MPETSSHTRSGINALSLSLPMASLLCGCQEGVLTTHGKVAAIEKLYLLEAVSAMLLVVAPVIALTLIYAWWFRASNKRAVYRPDWSYSGRIEFSIWMIPMLVVLFLGALAWSGAHELDPYQSFKSTHKPVRVEVVSLDWKWLFIYPDLGVASLNELALPTDTPIDFQLTSATVMNSFFIPGIAGQIYTMAGMNTRLSIEVNDPGVYRGLSAQFSGDGFSDMHFRVLATNADDFQKWIVKAQQSGIVLNQKKYDELAHAHATTAVAYFSTVEPTLFDHAIDQSASPATGKVSALALVNPTCSSTPIETEH